MLQFTGSNPGKWYGRLAGGTRTAEVDYIRSLLATEMTRADISGTIDHAVRTNATLPHPHKRIVGRFLDAVRRRLTRFWLAHRDDAFRWIAYHAPYRVLNWYIRRQGGLRQRMKAAFEREGIKDGDIAWVDGEDPWENKYDLLSKEERQARREKARVYPITFDRPDEVRQGFTPEQFERWRRKLDAITK